jgi:uncharacterized protein (TIGR00661 family)
MKILFVVTGIGLGHSVREHSIIKRIVRKNPETQIKILGFKNSYDYFRNYGYDTEKIFGHVFYGEELKLERAKMALLNLAYPFKFLINLFKIGRVIMEFNPDVVVCDAQPEGALAGKIFGKKVVLVYNLHFGNERVRGGLAGTALFFKRLFYPFVDKVINPSLVNRREMEGKVEVIPPVVRDRIMELPAENSLMKKFGFRKSPIIVQIGGSKFGSRLIKNIFLAAKEFPSEEFLVFGCRKRVAGNVKCLPFKSNFLEYLKVGKAVITLAGHEILSEIMQFRKAALVFPITYVEQVENAKLMKKNKLAIVGGHGQVEPDELKFLIEKLLSSKNLLEQRVTDLGIKENGADIAAGIILGQHL